MMKNKIDLFETHFQAFASEEAQLEGGIDYAGTYVLREKKKGCFKFSLDFLV